MARSDKDRIGFVGLGIMGRPMAGHLVDAGYETTVFDLLPDAVAQLEQKGASAGSSPADVADRSDITITMVPDSQHVEAAIAGPEGIIEGATPGSVVIDMSHHFAHGRPEARGQVEATGRRNARRPGDRRRDRRNQRESLHTRWGRRRCVRAVPPCAAGPRRRGNPHGPGRLGAHGQTGQPGAWNRPARSAYARDSSSPRRQVWTSTSS